MLTVSYLYPLRHSTVKSCLLQSSFLKTGSNFLLFCFYCSIVFIIILYKKWCLEFLINCFLKAGLTTALLPKTAISGRVFPSGGDWGDPHESMSPS